MNTVTAEKEVTVSEKICVDGYTLEESYQKGLDRLSEFYGVDFRTL